jgi:hypothetical protein
MGAPSVATAVGGLITGFNLCVTGQGVAATACRQTGWAEGGRHFNCFMALYPLIGDVAEVRIEYGNIETLDMA